MTAKLRTLSTAAFLIVGQTMLTTATEAADFAAEPHAHQPASAAQWRRDWRPHRCCWAHSELVAGVRGAARHPAGLSRPFRRAARPGDSNTAANIHSFITSAFSINHANRR